MPIYLVRTGQTVHHRKRFILGRDESKLTRLGRETIAGLAKGLSGRGIAALVHSPLARAAAAAGLYGQALGLSPRELDELTDLDAGQFTGRSRKVFLTPGDRLRPGWAECPEGVESYAAGEERALDALMLLKKMSESGPVLAVTHVTVSRIILKHYLNLSCEQALLTGHPLDAAYVLDGGKVSFLRADGTAGEGALGYDPE